MKAMKVVVTELIWPVGIERLEKMGCTVFYDPGLWKDSEALAEQLKDADALIVRNQTQVTKELLDHGRQLKVIGRLGVGLDNLDLSAAAKKNVVVVFGKNANATSVAEYVISAIFTCIRSLAEASVNVKQGHWDRKRFTGGEISSKTLGLIGVGEISHRVAVRANALGMRVMGYDPFVSPYDFPIAETGVELVDLERLFSESDFISLHVPLTELTRNLIDKDALTRMKSSAYVINSSRGGIINEDELGAALENKQVAGAVLDVLEQEPPMADHPLVKLNNCIITPHIAGLTEEAQVRTSELVANEVIRELEGNVSLCRVIMKR
jgi:D-3-phosphoglycerate dehydrogenase